MTPELQEAGARARAAYEARQAAAPRVGGFGRPLAGPEPVFTQGVALFVEDLCVSFDGFKALNSLSLTVDVGELRCIIGPNGAGTTAAENARQPIAMTSSSE